MIQRLLVSRLPSVAGIIVGVVFLVAGVLKFIDPSDINAGLRAIQVGVAQRAVVLWLAPGLEIGVGLSLIARWRSVVGVGMCITLLLSFSVFMVLLHIADTKATCGCFGGLSERLIGSHLGLGLGRNAVLLGMTLAFAAPWMFKVPADFERNAR